MNDLLKKSIIIVITGLALCLGTSGVFASGEGAYPMEKITIKGKKPVKFSHKTHVELGVTCGKCHHDSKNAEITGEAISAMKDKEALQCQSCHNDTFSNAKLQKRKDVFHKRCRDCHKAGYEGKKGPSKCTSCHEKKKKKKLEGC